MTWSETYVRYTWPDQSRMYDINDLIRDVCTIYMTWSETYVSDQVIYIVHTALIRSCISYIRLWSGHLYRTYVSDQVMYIVHTSLIRSFISYIRLWSGHVYRTYVSDQVMWNYPGRHLRAVKFYYKIYILGNLYYFVLSKVGQIVSTEIRQLTYDTLLFVVYLNYQYIHTRAVVVVIVW
jgi:hypothetical protein